MAHLHGSKGVWTTGPEAHQAARPEDETAPHDTRGTVTVRHRAAQAWRYAARPCSPSSSGQMGSPRFRLSLHEDEVAPAGAFRFRVVAQTDDQAEASRIIDLLNRRSDESLECGPDAG
jgi:hypothetical protein